LVLSGCSRSPTSTILTAIALATMMAWGRSPVFSASRR
jgi:hypothetical protein